MQAELVERGRRADGSAEGECDPRVLPKGRQPLGRRNRARPGSVRRMASVLARASGRSAKRRAISCRRGQGVAAVERQLARALRRRQRLLWRMAISASRRRLRARRRGVVDVVRGDDGQPGVVRQPQQAVQQPVILGQDVVLEFDKEMPAPKMSAGGGATPAPPPPPRPAARRHRPLAAAGQRNQPLGVRRQVVPAQRRRDLAQPGLFPAASVLRRALHPSGCA